VEAFEKFLCTKGKNTKWPLTVPITAMQNALILIIKMMEAVILKLWLNELIKNTHKNYVCPKKIK